MVFSLHWEVSVFFDMRCIAMNYSREHFAMTRTNASPRLRDSLASRLRSRGLKQVLLCGFLLGATLPGHTQSTFGSVRGAVQDPTGAAIPNTELVLHSVDENSDRTISADSSGAFIFENVKAGHYVLRAH